MNFILYLHLCTAASLLPTGADRACHPAGKLVIQGISLEGCDAAGRYWAVQDSSVRAWTCEERSPDAPRGDSASEEVYGL